MLAVLLQTIWRRQLPSTDTDADESVVSLAQHIGFADSRHYARKYYNLSGVHAMHNANGKVHLSGDCSETN